ncbi:ribosomal protein L37AE/L43A [Roseomonas alkaliterrae]|uniref:Ribosomal protein L37AE/L43A n=3 Tax=Neoroseomonas alkaliterrae TaxID=1452450 RepID=A0A840Y2S4_9PROT|nr:hypothetical protein [Neoroseomonas alkaliterrae]MBB5688523.1 ribosomal protein L37AE/L43A [Neoroseomonas alkaliterrae]
MSEIDRVFARLGAKKPTPEERRETVNVPRRGTAGSRVVEVVHVRSGAERADAGRSGGRVRAATWSEGFPARAAAAPPEPPAPPAAPAPTAHVMPGWQPAPAKAVHPATKTRPRGNGPRQARDAARRVADPFDTADDGANCLRCGYAVEPEREARGLLTCAACEARGGKG